MHFNNLSDWSSENTRDNIHDTCYRTVEQHDSQHRDADVLPCDK